MVIKLRAIGGSYSSVTGAAAAAAVVGACTAPCKRSSSDSRSVYKCTRNNSSLVAWSSRWPFDLLLSVIATVIRRCSVIVLCGRSPATTVTAELYQCLSVYVFNEPHVSTRPN